MKTIQVELDSIDPTDRSFQDWLSDHKITSAILDQPTTGPTYGFSVVRYTGTREAIELMAMEWFGMYPSEVAEFERRKS